MLDKAFMRTFFEKIESFTDAELDEKVKQIEKFKLTLPKDCEARTDANFMIKHLRREMLERHFTTPQ